MANTLIGGKGCTMSHIARRPSKTLHELKFSIEFDVFCLSETVARIFHLKQIHTLLEKDMKSISTSIRVQSTPTSTSPKSSAVAQRAKAYPAGFLGSVARYFRLKDAETETFATELVSWVFFFWID